CPESADTLPRFLPLGRHKVTGREARTRWGEHQMRIRAAVVAIVTLVVGLIAALISTPATAGPAVGPAVGQPAATRKAEEKIKPELRAQLTARSVAPVAFWVRFGERPDLSEAATIDDWKARGTAVPEALQ